MGRYFFHIAYKGTRYCGWQRQPDAVSIQEIIETELRKLFGQSIAIVGCGRTDTGVHASNYFFHADIEGAFDATQLVFKLNRMLPSDIAVYAIFAVSKDQHARFDAVSRTYHYFIHQFKDPFLEEKSSYVPQMLDVEKMNHAAELLIGTKDFTSFSKLHTDVKTNFCTVTEAKWTVIGEHRLQLTISANRFLRNMVRAVVGTLIDVGVGKIDPQEITQILNQKDRQSAGKSVPAHGLYLADVRYDLLGGK